MPRLSEQILIPYSPDDLYSLVKDIRRYPEFIKWIQSIQVSNEATTGQTYNCIGEVSVRFKGFEERFTTRVKADPVKRSIDVWHVRGPFRHLRNRWQLDPQGNKGTRVHFFVDYEFNSPVLGLLARANTRLAVIKIMQAFRAEADRRFKPPN